MSPQARAAAVSLLVTYMHVTIAGKTIMHGVVHAYDPCTGSNFKRKSKTFLLSCTGLLLWAAKLSMSHLVPPTHGSGRLLAFRSAY